MPVEVRAHITGTVWKIEVQVGDAVKAGDVVAILESMKMEIPIEAPTNGFVIEVRAREESPVDEGTILMVLDGTGA